VEDFELISGTKKITLNRSQQDFVLWYRNWRESDNLFACLSGSAGTGKTTASKYAIKDEYSICVTAPTHKAKKVISRATGRTAQTIQKIIGLKPNAELEEFTHQNLLFSLSPDGSTMHEYRLIVIDESSMINAELVKYLKEKAKSCKTKILFMGDINQLPPVKEVLGTVFTDPEIIQFKLTIVERQQFGNPLLGLYGNILSDINSKVDLYSKVSDIRDGLGYRFIKDTSNYSGLGLKTFKLGEYSDSKILAWTNRKVRMWNNQIRQNILQGRASDQLVVGEYLMAYKTVQDLVNWRITVTENSADYEVMSIAPSVRDQMYYDVNRKTEDFKVIYGYNVSIKDIDSGKTETIFVVDRQSYDDFAMIDITKSSYAKKLKGQERGYAWKLYFDFRNRYFLVGDITDLNGNIVCDKDLDYYYAQTVHKSQGSTYKNVIVDEANLDQFWDKKMTPQEICSTRNRLKYVAFSRPTDMALIYYK
jgi:AAA domain